MLLLEKETFMSYKDIIRAWKDAEYRDSLTEAQRSQIPDNPAGLIELSAAELHGIVGGRRADTDLGCCTGDYVCPFSEHGSGCAGTDKC
jgi:mersacidin/lichenicidin family type 2 lantibiotic